MTHRSSVIRSGILLSLFLALLCGCRELYPVRKDRIRVVTATQDQDVSSPYSVSPATTPPLIRIHWLGTACYLIEFGSHRILTDPYFTHFTMYHVWSGNLDPDRTRIDGILSPLGTGSAVFVGHAHYDHLLGGEAVLSHGNWTGAHLYGTDTAMNLLRDLGVAPARLRRLQTGDQWHSVQGIPGLHYKAFHTGHAPHVHRQVGVPLSISLYEGELPSPRNRPPRDANDYKDGGTHAILFRFESGPEVRFLYFGGSAHEFSSAVPADATGGTPIDAAIFCVPGWGFNRHYPDAVITRLQPRTVIATHFNDFFDPDYGRRFVVPTCDFAGFLDRVRRFLGTIHADRLVIADVGTVIEIP